MKTFVFVPVPNLFPIPVQCYYQKSQEDIEEEEEDAASLVDYMND